MIRKCCVCGTKIENCMGFVHAGDLLKYFKDRMSKNDIREYCGKCVFLQENKFKND